MPVTTVPKPLMVKARSMGRRKWPRGSLLGDGGTRRARALRGARRGLRRWSELTGTIGRAFEKGAGDELFDFQPHEAEDVVVDEVGLGERDDAARDAEQAADVEMLARLRLDRLVGGDDEEHQVDAADAGQHVLDEALVAGDVDEAEAQSGRELQVGEAEIDGDAAALFFFEAVGVDAGERFHERGLAVIDVSGGADDDVFHAACYSVKVLALPLLALVAGSLVYCVLTIVAAARYRAVRPAPSRDAAADQRPEAAGRGGRWPGRKSAQLLRAGVSRSSKFSSPCGARRTRRSRWWSDCAREYPAMPSRLIVTGEPPYREREGVQPRPHARGGRARSDGDGGQRYSRRRARCWRRSRRSSRTRRRAWRRARTAPCRGGASGRRWRRSG